MYEPASALRERLDRRIDQGRLLDTAIKLVAVPSPTNEAGAVLDVLAEILTADGFEVERPEAGGPDGPAVAVRLSSGKPGKTIQFNGHLDVVHLPFVPPQVEGDRLTGSGSCDMKGGTAAAIEALRALRDADVLSAGSVLLTAHDTHEAPWGFGEQLEGLIKAGFVGDAVLLPEPLTTHIPIAGRGQACWRATIRRNGPPIHEVMRPPDEPNVLAAGASLVQELVLLDRQVSRQMDPIAGRSSAFIGQLHGGEIYNQYPQECWLEGTRRWVPGTSRGEAEAQLRKLVAAVAQATHTTIDLRFQLVRDAFALDARAPIVAAFQSAFEAISGHTLPTGPKPFVDDGNLFASEAGAPAITHGPLAGGQHTTDEWVSIEDMVRVAKLYALTAAFYCPGDQQTI